MDFISSSSFIKIPQPLRMTQIDFVGRLTISKDETRAYHLHVRNIEACEL